MASKQEIKELMAKYPGRYTFDRSTGVCLRVDDRSLADRYPLDCDHMKLSREGQRGCAEWYTTGELFCYQAYKRLYRWQEYNRKELSR